MTDTADAEAPAIVVTSVAKSFGSTRALIDANMTVRRGESRALLGRNGAGKSTLIAMLTGLLEQDSGTIRIGAGDESEIVACVYQKSTLVPWLTVTENIYMGSYPRRFGFVDWKTMRRNAEALLAEWGYADIAGRLVDDLPPLERKIVEICRALASGPRILLLDEPTAGLDDGSVNELFEHIARARSRGVTVLYVSHHLEEVFKVCDSVTVLRDGRDVLQARTADLTIDDIVVAMSGAAVEAVRHEKRAEREQAQVVLDISDARVGEAVRGVSLSVRAGECVGVTGLDGAGHIHLAEAIVGIRKLDGGSVSIGGKTLKSNDVARSIDAGIGFVPEDRHHGGFVPPMSIVENATLPVIDRLTRGGVVSGSRRSEAYERLASTWTIVCDSPAQAVEELSGGNQQKVVLARALSSDPDVIVLMHPTAGVDVTAKNSIYRTLLELREQGKALVLVSADDDDLGICDRVVVMARGRVRTELEAGYTEHELVGAVQGA